jgi:uncharacterized protein (TIGR01777 family)
MKIVIPGGSGQVGTVLARAFQRDGHEVVVISRRPAAGPGRVIAWDGRTLGDWSKELDGCDAVINLAGRSVNCRYTAANRKAILDSRVLSTRVVGEAISRASRPPGVWLQASTATIYSHRYDAANDETSGLLGGEERDAPDTWKFSIDVARAWEVAFDQSAVPSRKVALRSAIVMSPDPGGTFDTLLGLVRRRLGGSAGDGRQYVSWIHHEDFVDAVRWLIEHEEIDGVVNVASPNPLPNREFMRALRQAAGVPIGLPPTRLMLEIGAVFMRTETELILKSRRVVPGRLLDRGFVFNHPIWREAAVELYSQWKLRSNAELAAALDPAPQCVEKPGWLRP